MQNNANELQEQLTREVFEQNIEELSKSLLEKVQSLRVYANRCFHEIYFARHDWHRLERCVETLKV